MPRRWGMSVRLLAQQYRVRGIHSIPSIPFPIPFPPFLGIIVRSSTFQFHSTIRPSHCVPRVGCFLHSGCVNIPPFDSFASHLSLSFSPVYVYIYVWIGYRDRIVSWGLISYYCVCVCVCVCVLLCVWCVLPSRCCRSGHLCVPGRRILGVVPHPGPVRSTGAGGTGDQASLA